MLRTSWTETSGNKKRRLEPQAITECHDHIHLNKADMYYIEKLVLIIWQHTISIHAFPAGERVCITPEYVAGLFHMPHNGRRYLKEGNMKIGMRWRWFQEIFRKNVKYDVVYSRLAQRRYIFPFHYCSHMKTITECGMLLCPFLDMLAWMCYLILPAEVVGKTNQCVFNIWIHR